MAGLDRRVRRGTQDDKLSCLVGTAFMPSGDSSPCTTMNSGSKRAETVHGDESPDGINWVPTNIFRNRFLGIFSLPGGSKLEEGRSDDKACA
jgi:hypothetical protein